MNTQNFKSNICATTADTKMLVLGVARTGAKFTPYNHKDIGDRVKDAINSGDLIPVTPDAVKREIACLYKQGVRYFHEHARNPESQEQSCDLNTYRFFSDLVTNQAPKALLSFGGSRNGPEIAQAIKAGGEVARIAQAGLARDRGGADFVTTQAAIELQIVKDMERQGYVRIMQDEGYFQILKPLADYVPSHLQEAVKLDVNSTTNGANYGKSSAAIQWKALQWSLKARKELNLPYEVEWVQHARSWLLTHYLANFMPNGLREIGRLNITLLFGFSARLPFPESYGEFKSLVRKARAIATPIRGGAKGPLKVSVAVGAAVLSHHAKAQMRPVDVGPLKGMVMGPMERLAVYAAQADSDVDILRVGLEDTPYLLSPEGVTVPATNSMLVERAKSLLAVHNVVLIDDPKAMKQMSNG